MPRQQRPQRTLRIRLSDMQYDALVAALEAAVNGADWERAEAVLARVRKAWEAAGRRTVGWAGYRNPHSRKG